LCCRSVFCVMKWPEVDLWSIVSVSETGQSDAWMVFWVLLLFGYRSFQWPKGLIYWLLLLGFNWKSCNSIHTRAFKYFTMQKLLSSKNPLKETQKSFKIYYNTIITNLKFQHKSKYHLSKILIEIDLFITYSPNSLKQLYSIMNLNTISLPW
jgi:hypothetical protein